MFRARSIQSSLSIKDKIISIDYIYEGLSENENSSKVKIKDYINLLKNNKAILVVCLTTVIMNLFM